MGRDEESLRMEKGRAEMKVIPKRYLFWFLKKGKPLDLTEPSVLDMYVQQIITRGRAEDVKVLLEKVNLEEFKRSLRRIGGFLPKDVRKFWEDFIASTK